MCLYEEAHGVVASHPIFQGPFPVMPTLHDMATPEHYRRLLPEGALGETMPAWRVHRDKVSGYVGVVADGYGYEDSPDAEWIASGRNSKNATAVALGRQGNLFHWGFAASPPEMTDEARAVFLNTLVYMQRFAGHAPLVAGKNRSREWLRAFAAPAAGPSGYAKGQMPQAWLDAAGDDASKLRALCEAQLGYLHRDGKRWAVDADCRDLEVDNRTVAGLRRCVELLDGERADAARRILERYTDRRFTTSADWRTWLDENGPRLFHSDVVGVFRVAPAGMPAPHRAK